MIDAPGFYYDVPSSIYHADPCPIPSLSSGILRTIVGQSIEHAASQHSRIGGVRRDSTPAMGLGSVVHGLLAGDASELEKGPFENYKTGAAQLWKRETELAGKAPVLERDLVDARPIVQAIRDKAGLGITNDPFSAISKSEVTAVWREGNAWCRARYDRLAIDPYGYADIWDWKTTRDISDRGIAQSIAKMGYHIQAAFYLRGLLAIKPLYAGRVSFIFCFVETAPPYHVRRAVLSQTFLRIGHAKVNEGLSAWQHAQATNDFRAPFRDTLEVEAPAYLEDDDEISMSD